MKTFLTFISLCLILGSSAIALCHNEGFKVLQTTLDTRSGLQKRSPSGWDDSPMDKYNYLPEEGRKGSSSFSRKRSGKGKKKGGCFSGYNINSDEENEWDQTYEETPAIPTSLPFGPGNGSMTMEKYIRGRSYMPVPSYEYFEYRHNGHNQKAAKASREGKFDEQSNHLDKACRYDEKMTTCRNPDKINAESYRYATAGYRLVEYGQYYNKLDKITKGMRYQTKGKSWANAYNQCRQQVE